LPELGQSIGKMLAEFKAAVNKTDEDKKDQETGKKD
jgi:conserved domain protein